MSQRNAWSRCTAQQANGEFCDVRSLPEAPFPICLSHAAELVRYVAQVVDTTTEGDLPKDPLELFRRFGTLLMTTPNTEAYPRPKKFEVYYLALGNLVKIGYTGDLKARLTAYPPMVELLAVEPGGPEIEQMRHAQFAHLRQHGPKSEWFTDAPELREHIAALTKAA